MKKYRAIMVYPAWVGATGEPLTLFPSFIDAYGWAMDTVDRWEYKGCRPIGVLIWSDDTLMTVKSETLLSVRKRSKENK